MADDTSTSSDTDASSTTTDATDAATVDATTTEEATLPDGVKKALAAARKDAREAEKARKALEIEVNTYKQRDMTEQQKLEQRAKDAETAAEAATRELNRIRAATAAGLELADADLITGATPAEMKASAERLAERFGGQRTNFDGGVRTPANSPTDMNDLIRSSLRGGR